MIAYKHYSNKFKGPKNGSVYFYNINTTTQRTVFSDPDGTLPLTQPIVFDSKGEANIYIDDTYKYTCVFFNENNTEAYAIDFENLRGNVQNSGKGSIGDPGTTGQQGGVGPTGFDGLVGPQGKKGLTLINSIQFNPNETNSIQTTQLPYGLSEIFVTGTGGGESAGGFMDTCYAFIQKGQKPTEIINKTTFNINYSIPSNVNNYGTPAVNSTADNIMKVRVPNLLLMYLLPGGGRAGQSTFRKKIELDSNQQNTVSVFVGRGGIAGDGAPSLMNSQIIFYPGQDSIVYINGVEVYRLNGGNSKNPSQGNKINPLGTAQSNYPYASIAIGGFNQNTFGNVEKINGIDYKIGDVYHSPGLSSNVLFLTQRTSTTPKFENSSDGGLQLSSDKSMIFTNNIGDEVPFTVKYPTFRYGITDSGNPMPMGADYNAFSQIFTTYEVKNLDGGSNIFSSNYLRNRANGNATSINYKNSIKQVEPIIDQRAASGGEIGGSVFGPQPMGLENATTTFVTDLRTSKISTGGFWGVSLISINNTDSNLNFFKYDNANIQIISPTLIVNSAFIQKFDITSLDNGGFAVGVIDNNIHKYAVYNSSGVQVQPYQNVNSGSGNFISLSPVAGGFLIANTFQDGNGRHIRIDKYNNLGVFIVNLVNYNNPNNVTEILLYPRMVTQGSQTLLTYFGQNTGLAYLLFNNINGVILNPATTITTNNGGQDSDIYATRDGNFVTFYQDNNNDYFYQRIKFINGTLTLQSPILVFNQSGTAVAGGFTNQIVEKSDGQLVISFRKLNSNIPIPFYIYSPTDQLLVSSHITDTNAEFFFDLIDVETNDFIIFYRKSTSPQTQTSFERFHFQKSGSISNYSGCVSLPQDGALGYGAGGDAYWNLKTDGTIYETYNNIIKRFEQQTFLISNITFVYDKMIKDALVTQLKNFSNEANLSLDARLVIKPGTIKTVPPFSSVSFWSDLNQRYKFNNGNIPLSNGPDSIYYGLNSADVEPRQRPSQLQTYQFHATDNLPGNGQDGIMIIEYGAIYENE